MGEDEVDLLNVLGAELVLVLALGVFAVGVDEEQLATQGVGLVLVRHDDAGGNAGAIEESWRQADSAKLLIASDENLAFGQASTSVCNTSITFTNIGALIKRQLKLTLSFGVQEPQRKRLFGESISVSAGKFDMMTLASKTPLVGGGGIDTFMNRAFALPSTGVA
jgi:hypothetical protein